MGVGTIKAEHVAVMEPLAIPLVLHVDWRNCVKKQWVGIGTFVLGVEN